MLDHRARVGGGVFEPGLKQNHNIYFILALGTNLGGEELEVSSINLILL